MKSEVWKNTKTGDIIELNYDDKFFYLTLNNEKTLRCYISFRNIFYSFYDMLKERGFRSVEDIDATEKLNKLGDKLDEFLKKEGK